VLELISSFGGGRKKNLLIPYPVRMRSDREHSKDNCGHLRRLRWQDPPTARLPCFCY